MTKKKKSTRRARPGSAYKTIAKTIRRHEIPQALIADLSKIWRPDLTAFLNGRIGASPEREALIQQTVNDVVRLLETSPYRPDLRRVADVRKLIQAANDAEKSVLAEPRESVNATETTNGTEVAVTL